MPASDLYNFARSHDVYKARKIRLQAQWNFKSQLSLRARLGNALINPPSPARCLRISKKLTSARRRRFAANLEPKSHIDGFLIAAKDNICTSDLPTTCASSILQGFKPHQDAQAVQRLQGDGGALVVVKANMDEFGMGSHSTHSVHGPVQNFIGNAARSAGGSSGGSAVAVATDQCYLALGTDTGGSVRLPAAYTGLAGFKPSYGMISRQGIVPYANSLDTVGIIARSCFDILHAFKILNMADSRDPTSLSRPTRRRIGEVRKVRQRSRPSQGLITFVPVHKGRLYNPNDVPLSRKRTIPVPEIRWRVGVPTEYNIEEMSDAVREAWVRTLSLLASRGHEIVPISLPTTKHALSAYYVLAPAEASSNLAKYDGVRYGLRSKDHADSAGGVLYSETRGQNFGKEVKRRILLGAYSLSADAIDNYFIQAQKVRRLVQKDFDAIFKMPNPMRDIYQTPPDGVDYIVCPTSPTPPPLLEDLRKSTPLDAYMNDVFTVPASLAGLPAVSVPAPSAEHVSSVEENFIGMQVVGQFGDDYGVLQFASQQLQVGQDWEAVRVSAHVRENRRIR